MIETKKKVELLGAVLYVVGTGAYALPVPERTPRMENPNPPKPKPAAGPRPSTVKSGAKLAEQGAVIA